MRSYQSWKIVSFLHRLNIRRLAVLVLLLLANLLPCAANQQEQREKQVVVPPFLPKVGAEVKRPWQRYENLVYHYALSLPGEFIHAGDKIRTALLEEPVEQHKDMLYDMQAWFTPDQKYTFEVQLKEPSYASLQEEIDNLPGYLDLIRGDYEKNGLTNLRFAHDRIVVHNLPAGSMLENATLYDRPTEASGTISVCSVYYDYYDDTNEYIFHLTGYGMSYEETSALLHKIAATIAIKPVHIIVPLP